MMSAARTALFEKLCNLYGKDFQVREDARDLHEKIRQIRNGTDFNEVKESFFEKLLFKKENGFANVGMSIVKNEKKTELNSDKHKNLFLDVIKLKNESELGKAYKDFISTDKTADTDKRVGKWEKIFGTNNLLLINRFFCACSAKLCHIVDKERLEFVAEVFRQAGIVDFAWDKGENWFENNIKFTAELMKKIEDNLRLRELFGEDEETAMHRLSTVLWEFWCDMNKKETFFMQQQKIYYGAPGTGKTYTARQEAERIYTLYCIMHDFQDNANHIETVQFHSGYGYEDFIEGIRPVRVNNDIQLGLQNGIFKNLCMEAGKWEIDFYEFNKNHQKNFDFDTLTVDDLKKDSELKKYLADKEHWQKLDGTMKKVKAGTLVKDILPPYFMIVDEINRAELSRVFGELFYALEYRGTKGKIKTQYAQLNTKETAMLYEDNAAYFFVPHNVFIVGTMNTIDKSIESIDFALRRRFLWQEFEPDMQAVKSFYGNDAKFGNLYKGLEALNTKIAQNPYLGKDYCIGHAYVMNEKYLSFDSCGELQVWLWQNRIEPLLKEYLRGVEDAKNELKEMEKIFLKKAGQDRPQEETEQG